MTALSSHSTPSASESEMKSSSSSSSPTTSIITLQDGRSMHYAIGGAISSTRIIITLHGVFGIGNVTPSMSKWCDQRGWCCIAPTLPGWGQSSPYPKYLQVSAYVDDIRELLSQLHIHPTSILIFGGSYGSVWAYGVAANKPPKSSSPSPSPKLAGLPPCIHGLFIMGGFSPFREHSQHIRDMSWMNYLTVSSIGKYAPFSWFHSMIGRVLQKKMKFNIPGSLEILRKILTGEKAMTSEERNHITHWAQTIHNETFEQWELNMATNMSQSVAQLDGYDQVCATLNADWGFHIKDIKMDEPITLSSTPLSPLRFPFGGSSSIPTILPSIILCGALRDHLAPINMMQWVNQQLPGSQLIELEGNHISGITSLLGIMDGIIKGIETQVQGHHINN